MPNNELYNVEVGDLNILKARVVDKVSLGTYQISVLQLPTKTVLNGMSMPQSIKSNASIKAEDLSNLAGKSFDITYNGETKAIAFGENEVIGSASELENVLKAKIENAFGTSQIEVSVKLNKLTLSSATSLKIPVTVSSGGSGTDALECLHIDNGASTAFGTTRTLESFLGASGFGETDEMKISVNGKNFTFTKNETISDVFSKLNKDADTDISINFIDSKERMIVTRNTYGTGRDIELAGGDSDTAEGKNGDTFWKNLKLNYYWYEEKNWLDRFESLGGSYTTGDNGSYTLTTPDNVSMSNISVNSNPVRINGLELTFLQADSTKTVSIVVTKNENVNINGKLLNGEGLKIVAQNVLTKANTTAYTPTADYHPTTKKYVDEHSIKILEASTDNVIDFNALTEPGIYFIKGCSDTFTTTNAGISASVGKFKYDVILQVINVYSSDNELAYINQVRIEGDYSNPWRRQKTVSTGSWSSWSNTITANSITSGTLGGTVKALSNREPSTAQVRNIQASTTDLTAGTSTLATGDIYLVYE